MASFGATGARIGYAAKAHVAIDADSGDFNDGSTTLASVVTSDGMAGIVIPNSGAVIGGTSSEPVLWIKRTNDNGRIAIGSGHGKPTGEEIQILDGCVYMPSGMSPAAISFGLGGTEATSGTIYAEGRITGAGVTSNGDDSFRANITAFDSTAANPSASQTTHGLLVYDSAGVIVGQIRCARLTDGRIGIALVARQGTSASGGIKQNALWMYTAKDGTATYTVPTPANFRSAIGLGTLATKSSVAASDIEKTAWAYLVGSASTVASGNYVRWRMVAGIVFLQVCYRSGAGLTAGSAKSIGNIPANYRPSSTVESTGYLGAGKASPGDIWVETNGNAYIISATVASATFYGTLCYPLG